jgi:predicted nucleic acid-binding protein
MRILIDTNIILDLALIRHPFYDQEEDRHVLETAIAGKANYLITANWKDFLVKETQKIIPERHYRYISPSHTIEIVHPYLMMEWIRQDKLLI